MKSSEFITEALTSPYNVDFHNGVTWPKSSGGNREILGVDAEFTTDAGINYNVSGKKVGTTKADREKKLAARTREEERIAAGEHVLQVPGNTRHGGIWEIHFSQQDTERDYTQDKTGLTDSGDEFRVFATVLAVISRIVRVYNPEILSIKVANEANRIRLYERMAKKYASKIGFTYVKTTPTVLGARIELKRIDTK